MEEVDETCDDKDENDEKKDIAFTDLVHVGEGLLLGERQGTNYNMKTDNESLATTNLKRRSLVRVMTLEQLRMTVLLRSLMGEGSRRPEDRQG